MLLVFQRMDVVYLTACATTAPNKLPIGQIFQAVRQSLDVTEMSRPDHHHVPAAQEAKK